MKKFVAFFLLFSLNANAFLSGTQVIRASGSIPFSGNQSLGGFRLTSVGDPVSAQDAATKHSVDATVNPFFGSGADGDLVMTTGAQYLDHDMYYHNLTLSGDASIYTSGWQLYVSGTLDITAAGPGAFLVEGGSGETPSVGASNGGSGGSPNYISQAFTVGVGYGGGSGGNGTNTNGTQGSFGNLPITGAGGQIFGGSGQSGKGGDGGAGNANHGGALQNTGGFNVVIPQYLTHTFSLVFGTSGSYQPNIVDGGSAGGGGGGGAGDGSHTGPGGGGGGASGGVIFIAAHTIARSGSTQGIIDAKGGAGGTGGHVTSCPAGAGGGGGANGGAGGFVYLAYSQLTGSPVTGLIDASGGASGNGGAKCGTGTDGVGGDGSDSGNVTLINTTTGVVTFSTSVIGTAHSGITAGTSGVLKVAL